MRPTCFPVSTASCFISVFVVCGFQFLCRNCISFFDLNCTTGNHVFYCSNRNRNMKHTTQNIMSAVKADCSHSIQCNSKAFEILPILYGCFQVRRKRTCLCLTANRAFWDCDQLVFRHIDLSNYINLVTSFFYSRTLHALLSLRAVLTVRVKMMNNMIRL